MKGLDIYILYVLAFLQDFFSNFLMFVFCLFDLGSRPKTVCAEIPGLALLKDKVSIGTRISKCFKIFLSKIQPRRILQQNIFSPHWWSFKNKTGLQWNGTQEWGANSFAKQSKLKVKSPSVLHSVSYYKKQLPRLLLGSLE